MSLSYELKICYMYGYTFLLYSDRFLRFRFRFFSSMGGGGAMEAKKWSYLFMDTLTYFFGKVKYVTLKSIRKFSHDIMNEGSLTWLQMFFQQRRFIGFYILKKCSLSVTSWAKCSLVANERKALSPIFYRLID